MGIRSFAASGVLVLLALVFSSPGASGSPGPPGAVPADLPAGWWDGFDLSGFDGRILAGIVYQGDVVVGGEFDRFNDTGVRGVARWNGSDWVPLGGGVGFRVQCFAVHDDTLFAGGGIGAAYWVNGSWTSLPDPGWIDDLVVYGGMVHAAHEDRSTLTRWTGAGWDTLDSGFRGRGPALALYDGKLAVGGLHPASDFRTSVVLTWDGATWTQLGDGITYSPTASPTIVRLLADGTDLYVAGHLTHAGAVASREVLRWDGNAWQAMGSDLAGFGVNDLALLNGSLYAAARSTRPDLAGLARWNGTAWEPAVPGTRFPGVVAPAALVSWGNAVVCGGDLVLALEGGSWTQLGTPGGGQGLNAAPSALTVWNGEVVAGGSFTVAGGRRALHLARWDGARWHEIGGGTDRAVYSLAVVDGDLVVGGNFLHAGEVWSPYVARWDGAEWHALNDEPNPSLVNSVAAVAAFDGGLVVGGQFPSMGGVPAANVARLGDGGWEPLGSGLTGCYGIQVRALTVRNGVLFAGGTFLDAGGTEIHHLASWDGSTWRAVNGSMAEGCDRYVLDDVIVGVSVQALLFRSDGLWVGGDYDGVVGAPGVARLGRWNHTWAGLPFPDQGSGWSSVVEALAEYDGDLVVGGDFTEVGTPPVANTSRLGRFSATSLGWSSFGAGITDGEVTCLAASGPFLYAGGTFTGAGGHPSYGIARWSDDPVPVKLAAFTAGRAGGGVRVRWTVSGDPVDHAGFRVHRGGESGVRRPVSGLLSGRVSYEFVDSEAPATPVDYWLEEIARSGGSTWYGPVSVGAAPAVRFALAPARPNPFAGEAGLRFTLAEAGPARLTVFDLAGRQVAVLFDGPAPAGETGVRWDGRDASGREAPAGIYFYRLEGADGVRTRRLVKLR